VETVNDENSTQPANQQEAYPSKHKPQAGEPDWSCNLTDRGWQEVRFACAYINEFDHGTDGHGRLHVIARLAELLTENEREIAKWCELVPAPKPDVGASFRDFECVMDEAQAAAFICGLPYEDMYMLVAGIVSPLAAHRRLAHRIAVRRRIESSVASNMLDGALAVIRGQRRQS
jgi:hypothetical protein